MAEADDPYAKFVTAPAEDDPYAKFVTKKEAPGQLEDVAKGGGVGLAQGVIAIPGMGGDLQQLATAATNRVGNPFGWLTNKFDENFPNASKFLRDESAKTLAKSPSLVHSGDMMMADTPLPSSADIQKKVEETTGPFYQAQTPLGKAAQTAGQVLPAVAAGGEGLLPSAIKAGSAGAVSEGAGELADAGKGLLPTAAQPYAGPAARAVGSLAGLFGPAALRSAVTPLPMASDQAAAVSALKGKIPMTAGQQAESPGLMTMEGRTSKFSGLPDQQSEAFTQGAMGHMGQDGLATTGNLAQSKALGDELGNLRRGNEINPNEFPQLNKDMNTIVKKYSGTVGKDDAQVLADIQQKIRMGASNNTNVASMPGGRYDYMRQKLQTAIENSGTGTESNALSDMRKKLDEAFHRSIPADTSARVKELENQYANSKSLDAIPRGPNENTFTPKQVFDKAHGPLKAYAENADRVMTPLPPRNTEIGDVTHMIGMLGGSLLGGASHAGSGLPAMATGAAEGSLSGLFGFPHAVNAAKDVAGRAISSAPAQAYLKNQAWLPGANTAAPDKATLIRMLMTPQAKPLVPSQ